MSALDTYLRAQSDRCPGCGFHRETQGCACDGTLRFAERGKAESDEWAVFTAALRQAADGSEVHQSRVRPLLRGRIEPKHVGLCYRRAIREGLLREIRRERSDDEAGRNTNKWEPVYELRRTA